MMKWGMLLFSVLFLMTGCSSVRSTNNTNSRQPSTTGLTSVSVPDDSDVKSLTVWSSALPGAKRMTFTNATNKSTIELVLSWLNHSKEVGFEKPAPGKDGCPPGLSITTTNGNTILIGPSVNWTVKKYPSKTVISGADVVGYVAIHPDNSKVIRVYCPKLYKWITNYEWAT